MNDLQPPSSVIVNKFRTLSTPPPSHVGLNDKPYGAILIE